MGRIRRGGYIFVWWKGDHEPKHVHVFDNDAELIARVRLDTMKPIDVDKIEKRVIELIRELQEEGRL